MNKKIKILIVDDEKDIRDSLKAILDDEGYLTYLAEDANEAKKILDKEKDIRCMFLDIWMPGCDGITLLKELKSNNIYNNPVIMMSGHGTIDTAVNATKLGAMDFIEKPLSLQKVIKVTQDAIKKSLKYPNLTYNFFEKTKINPMQSYFKSLFDVNEIKIIDDELYSEELFQHIKNLDKDRQVKKIDLDQLSYIEEFDVFIEENKNQTLVISISEVLANSKKVLEILRKKLKEFNINLILIKNKINIDIVKLNEFNEIKIIKLNIFENNHDLKIDVATDLLSYYLNSIGNIIYCEFELAALNQLRSNKLICNLIDLDAVVKLILEDNKAEVITSEVLDYAINKINKKDFKEINQDESFFSLYEKPIKEARDEFEKGYFQFHLKNKMSMTKLSEISGIERTHLYRKLKQLGLKD